MKNYERFVTIEKGIEYVEATEGTLLALTFKPDLNWEQECERWTEIPHERRLKLLVRRRVQLTGTANPVIVRAAFGGEIKKEMIYRSGGLGYIVHQITNMTENVKGESALYG